MFALIIFASTLITMPAPVYAVDETQSFNWYAKRNKQHTLPEIEPQMKFIEGFNAVYGDKKAAENGDKVIYLTFDAGYENGNVEKIVNTLKKHNAPGAFFVLENFIKRNAELVKRMASEGHLICNHTMTHPDMTKISDKAKFEAQLSDLNNVLKEYCGVEMAKFYRPPEGKFSAQNLRYATELGYKTVFWSFAYADWDNNRQPSEDDAIKKILENAHPGEIMLLHPTSKTNADILDRVLTALENEGYRFASLNELP
jgi:peptidoglycan-N-acetylmuramic acid deacetylase